MTRKKYFLINYFYQVFPAFLLLTAIVFISPAQAIDSEAIVTSCKINESSQVLLVINDKPLSFIAKLYVLEKQDGKWKQQGKPVNAVIGKNGFARPDEKREGDGKSPSGIFPLLRTFGYPESIRTKMSYRQALPDDLWIDDVESADYNRWVKKGNTQALSYERMRRDDYLYKYGIVIEYNTNPVVKGYGSAIFFHIWRGENMATEGCIAVSENDMVRILDWLDPLALPMTILGTENTIEGIK